MLPEGDPQRLVGLIDVVDPLCQIGRIEDARAAAAELDASPDRRYQSFGAVLGCTIDFYAGTHDRQATQARIDAARSAFLELGEELGLAHCELLQAGISWTALRAEETRAAASRGLAHAAAAGADHILHELDGWEFPPLVFGPLPVEEGLRLTESALERAKGKLLFEARLWSTCGRLLAMRGEADRGRELVRAGLDRAREAGLLVDAAAGSMAAAFVELHAGDLQAAERIAREGLPELERLGDRAHHPTLALMLADVLVLQGRYDEAESWCRTARETSGPDDLVNFVDLDLIEGFLRAQRGEHDDGAAQVRRGLALAETTDFFDVRGRGQEALAHTLVLAGKKGEAREAAERAVAIFEGKGDVPFAARARRLLDEVAVSV